MVTEEDSEDDSFLGVIHVDTATVSQEWTIPVTLNREFKIDTGADVTVIPETVYEKERDGPMSRVEIRLSGASQHPLHVCGKFQGSLQRNITKTKQDIYVVRGLQKPLLGRPAIEALRVVTMVEPISQPRVEEQFRDLFEGLGKLQDNYQIKLKDDARPFALTTRSRTTYV